VLSFKPTIELANKTELTTVHAEMLIIL
jgi:hypothetical protein